MVGYHLSRLNIVVKAIKFDIIASSKSVYLQLSKSYTPARPDQFNNEFDTARPSRMTLINLAFGNNSLNSGMAVIVSGCSRHSVPFWPDVKIKSNSVA